MSIDDLLHTAITAGAFIDERVQFKQTQNSGISAFLKNDYKENETQDCVSISIPNSLIIKPEDAYHAINIKDGNLVSSLIVFKFYLAMLKNGEISNDIFDSYIKLLPEMEEIGSPLSMPIDSLYVFENTSLNKLVIEKKIECLKKDYETGKKCIDSNISFENYLWSHLIITSRAFPYKIVNSNAESYEVMLLPVIDLLNHKPNSKVEWSSSSNKDFKLTILDSKTDELFNNYGPKGNAELLLGYGFVLENNEVDSLQLSLTLDTNLKNDILKNWNVKLPTIDDYTFNVIENKNIDKETSEYNLTTDIKDEPTVFMLNKYHPIAEGLLEIFCYISRNETDKGKTLKNVMNGVNKLRNSLEVKYSNKLDKMPAYDESLIGESNYNNAKIFRKGQLSIYNLTKNEIKNLEKKYLKDHRKNFITLKDIFKKDGDEFLDFLTVFQWDKDMDELNKMECELIFRLWLMKTINYRNNTDNDNTEYYEKMDILWAVEMFNARKENKVNVTENEEFMVDLYNQMIPSLKETMPELVNGANWELNDWLVIDQIIIENSYEKGKKLETLLIKPLEL